MTRQEAAKVMAVFATAFHRQVDEQEMEIWYQASLSRVPAQLAERVAARVVAESEWFPTVAQFNTVRTAVERGMQTPHRALPSPTPDETERERVKKLVAETHERLKA